MYELREVSHMPDWNLIIVVELIGADRCLVNTVLSKAGLLLISLLYSSSLYWVGKDRVFPSSWHLALCLVDMKEELCHRAEFCWGFQGQL
jgi:hypothetical protein